MFVFPPRQQQFYSHLELLSKTPERFSLKNTKTCVRAHVNRSPRRSTVYLWIQNLHNFFGREKREQIFRRTSACAWERKPHCLVKVFHRLSKKDILRRKQRSVSYEVAKQSRVLWESIEKRKWSKRTLRYCCVIRILDDCDTKSHTCSLIDHKWLSSPFIARSGVLERGWK